MGCCASGDENDGEIGRYMKNAENKDGRVFKLLLLGPGSTGKSTLFKSLRISHSGDIQTKEKRAVLIFVRQNVVMGIWTLLEQGAILWQKDPNKYVSCKINDGDITPELEEKISLINKYQKQTGYMDDTRAQLNYEEMGQLGEAISYIWSLDAIKNTWNSRANNFVFDDNLDYFFDKVQEVFKESYLPSNEDCLKNRIKTTGMTQYQYQPKEDNTNRFNIVDVGGQRAERTKWINYFDNVHALLFVASLVDYNTLLYEDETVNGMAESTKLFFDTTKLETFKECALILILNKDDLLQNLLQSGNHGLDICFSEKGNWSRPDEYWDAAIDEQYKNGEINFKEYHDYVIAFIADLFEHRNNLKTNLYKHVTVATQNQIVKQVFHDIQTIMVQNALKQSGYWTENM